MFADVLEEIGGVGLGVKEGLGGDILVLEVGLDGVDFFFGVNEFAVCFCSNADGTGGFWVVNASCCGFLQCLFLFVFVFAFVNGCEAYETGFVLLAFF